MAAKAQECAQGVACQRRACPGTHVEPGTWNNDGVTRVPHEPIGQGYAAARFSVQAGRASFRNAASALET